MLEIFPCLKSDVDTFTIKTALCAEIETGIEVPTTNEKRLDREKLFNFDNRLYYCSRNVKGINSLESNSETNYISSLRKKTKYAKDNAKEVFTENGRFESICLICGSIDNITLAHIVSSALGDYDDW